MDPIRILNEFPLEIKLASKEKKQLMLQHIKSFSVVFSEERSNIRITLKHYAGSEYSANIISNTYVDASDYSSIELSNNEDNFVKIIIMKSTKELLTNNGYKVNELGQLSIHEKVVDASNFLKLNDFEIISDNTNNINGTGTFILFNKEYDKSVYFHIEKNEFGEKICSYDVQP